MKIQTAGEQKYYDFIQERMNRLSTARIVWISLLCVALICSFSNIKMAVILGAIGVLLAVTNTKSVKALENKTEELPDKAEFFHQMTAPDNLEIPEAHILITKDYVLVMKTDLMIYQLDKMDKIEVGMAKDVQKTLFLTDKAGVRNEIISTMKGDGMQEEFDKVYLRLKARMN